ncbi:hypothetical protein [Burkholderia cenocepacia]|uniref:hypothetical protein n=1 Tax=Burkholderia cenocepacia TaxID=95486 RepID=UPI002861D0F0|nr:hypothetical protein [Burkholderia cenocepacia]MDR8049843.1 hypothetical protein [Burkholderia cenocepacia]
MTIVSMQADIRDRTVQIVLDTEKACATIYVVGGQRLAETPRIVDVRPYVESGMSDEAIAEHLLNVVTISIDETRPASEA